MIRLKRESRLAAEPSVVWDAVARMDGVNAELRPLVRLTAPAACNILSSDNPCLTRGFASWILLFGVIPVDRHRFRFAAIGARHFAERSTSRLNRAWEHDRVVSDDGSGGSLVRDELRITPRIRLLEPVVRAGVRTVFDHRHRYLCRRFGVPDR